MSIPRAASLSPEFLEGRVVFEEVLAVNPSITKRYQYFIGYDVVKRPGGEVVEIKRHLHVIDMIAVMELSGVVSTCGYEKGLWKERADGYTSNALVFRRIRDGLPTPTMTFTTSFFPETKTSELRVYNSVIQKPKTIGYLEADIHREQGGLPVISMGTFGSIACRFPACS